jgi:hypothetical protein
VEPNADAAWRFTLEEVDHHETNVLVRRPCPAGDARPRALALEGPEGRALLSTIPAAAAELGRYDYVVLGDELEKTEHPDHANTVAILAHRAMAQTAVFGYVDLGVRSQNLPPGEIQTRVGAGQRVIE